MSDLLCEQEGKIFIITMNRVEKLNAFDDSMLAHLQLVIDDALDNPSVAVIILMANGPHFSAGADVSWMQRMANFNKEENQADALLFAHLMYTLHTCPKPTIAMIQGAAFGGGAGLAAACDIAIAAETARFCFSEVKFGLIPAVISPYVIKAIGERSAIELFMTAQVVSAQRAYELKLIQHCVPESELLTFTLDLAEKITQNAPLAVQASKALARLVGDLPIDEAMQVLTASLIAEKRVSTEGQSGLKAFLNKTTPNWN